MRKTGWIRLALVVVASLAGCVLASPAAAYVLRAPNEPPEAVRPAWPGPVVTFEARAYRRAVRRAVVSFNRLNVGVRLKRARRAPADIRFTYGGSGCRRHLGMTFRVREGGGPTRAGVRLARGCTSRRAFMAAAHELGHAMGLKHENRRCSLMNSYLLGEDAVPMLCSSRNDWMRQPFRRDDFYGLRRLWRNTPPHAAIAPITRVPTAGVPVRFGDASTDAQGNIKEVTWDFGVPGAAGNTIVRGGSTYGAITSNQGAEYTYQRPGSYRVHLLVKDSYGRTSSTWVDLYVGRARRR